MVDDATIAKLRHLFADELADHVGRLEQATAAALREPGGAGGGGEALAREVRRSAHTLKGSARVTGFAAIESLCEALEHRLAEPGATALAPLRAALPVLRDAARDLTRGRPIDEGRARSVARSIAAGDVDDAEEPGPLTHDDDASAMVPSAPSVAGAPATLDGDTVRVPIASVAQLLASAQDLQAITTRMRGAGHGTLETGLTDAATRLARALRSARALAQTLDDDRATTTVLAIEAAAEALRASTSAARALDVEHARAWGEARNVALEISERSRRLRIRPFGSVASTVEATARDAAAALGKSVEVVVEGEAAQVDRRVLEGLREPLLHLVRNAVDHGLESATERRAAGKPASGRLRIRGSLAGVEFTVEVNDDGRGVDLARVRARALALGLDPGATPRETLANLFEPGFTTRETPTAISGRGVGLDVVRQRIAQLHGRVSIETTAGTGTTFRLVVPSDLSILRGLVVRARDAHVVIPTTTVERVMRVSEAELVVIDGRQHVATDRGPVPLADLDALLGFPARGGTGLDGARRPAVVLAIAERRIALRLDALLDERPVVVQPLGPRIRRLALVSGGVVLEDGELALLLDVGDALRLARATLDAGPRVAPRARHVLLVDDSVTTRQLERTLLEAAGYVVSVAADGLDAWAKLEGQETYDAIVSDLEMPNLDGFALLARIRGTPRLARLPVVLVTALASDDDRQRALDLGASAYLTKRGFDDEALLDALEELT